MSCGAFAKATKGLPKLRPVMVGQRFLERLRDDGGFHVEFGQGSEGHSSQAQTRRAARIDAAGEQIIACIQGDLAGQQPLDTFGVLPRSHVAQ